MSNPAVTYTFINNQASDGPQVSQNFADLITAMTDGTKDFSIGNLTVSGTVTFPVSSNLVLNGGNTLAAALTVGTNDSNDLIFETNNVSNAKIAAAGGFYVKQGSAAGITLKTRGCIYSIGTNVLNTSTTETDLHSTTLLANSLAQEGDGIVISGHGFLENNANQKTVKVYLGSTSFTLLSAVTTANKRFSYEVRIIRTGASQQRQSQWVMVDGLSPSVTGTNSAVTTSSDQTVKSTGQSNTASNDILETMFSVDYITAI